MTYTFRVGQELMTNNKRAWIKEINADKLIIIDEQDREYPLNFDTAWNCLVERFPSNVNSSIYYF